ncbi:MAG: hydrogenase maturation protease [Firmicutes bacterium]|nr:hydrogenase maturation protease [Bacillota bacterium]
MKKLKIIGCGSLLTGDDAAGCKVAENLLKMNFPPDVKIIEAGTPGLNLLHLMEPGDNVIIIDAVCSGKPAGTITVFSEAELPQPEQMPLSAHQLAIPEAIKLGRTVQPELMPQSIEIWGIEVTLPLKSKMEISPEIKTAIQKMTEKVKQMIEKT